MPFLVYRGSLTHPNLRRRCLKVFSIHDRGGYSSMSAPSRHYTHLHAPNEGASAGETTIKAEARSMAGITPMRRLYPKAKRGGKRSAQRRRHAAPSLLTLKLRQTFRRVIFEVAGHRHGHCSRLTWPDGYRNLDVWGLSCTRPFGILIRPEALSNPASVVLASSCRRFHKLWVRLHPGIIYTPGRGLLKHSDAAQHMYSDLQ